jgi:hypothetical protein
VVLSEDEVSCRHSVQNVTQSGRKRVGTRNMEESEVIQIR